MLSSSEGVEWATEEPSKFAYKLREGMEAARHHSDGLPYSNLQDKFIIRVLANKVRAEVKGKQPSLIEKAKASLSTKSFPEVTGLYELIGAAVHSKEAERITFPNCVIHTAEDMTKLLKWSKTSQYEVDATEGIILTRIKL